MSDSPGLQSYSIRRPMGVVAAIAPFNCPLLLSIRKVGWAIVAGNSVVLKPSEAPPVIGLNLAEIFSQAGLPDGVLNCVPAIGADLDETLIAHKKIKEITFTGSTKVGKAIAMIAATHNKNVTLEMGGKNSLATPLTQQPFPTLCIKGKFV